MILYEYGPRRHQVVPIHAGCLACVGGERSRSNDFTFEPDMGMHQRTPRPVFVHNEPGKYVDLRLLSPTL